MLDKTSMRVVAYIRAFDSAIWYYNRGFAPPFPLSFREFLLCLDHLESEGYVSVDRVPGGVISASLTHKGLHAKEFNMMAAGRYLLDKWFDILTALVSLAALILSLIAILQ